VSIILAPTGLEPRGLSSIPGMIQWWLELIGVKREHTRDEIIRLRYAAGEKLSDIGRSLGLSTQRVHQIVKAGN
jgi:Sigma-70, region 4